MKIQIEMEFADTATFVDVKNMLCNVHEFARFAAMTNAATATLGFGENVPKYVLKMDEPMRELLRTDVEQALRTFEAGNPCTPGCVNEGICTGSCDKLSAYENARAILMQTHALCNTTCEHYAAGTCPFGTQTKNCPKYGE